MLIGCLLMVLGLVLIVINPFVGVAPGLLLIIVGIVAAILGGFFRTVAGVARGGRTASTSRGRIDRE